jgi:aryl-alcohol dehydrogenase-like predicted oxidoreductase
LQGLARLAGERVFRVFLGDPEVLCKPGAPVCYRIPMRTRPCGEESFELTELGLGTWGLSGDGYGPVPELEQDRVIERALALGIRVFETADCYATGQMEQRLGRLLPKDAFVITKIGTRLDATPPRKDFSRAYLEEAFERSFERLGREQIDCVLLHNPSAASLTRPELVELMGGLKEKGRVRTWGVSSGGRATTRAALAINAPVIALAYNLYHRSEIDWLSLDLVGRNVAIFAHSVLAHGLLAASWPANKEFPPGDHRAQRWTPDGLRRRQRQLVAIKPALGGGATTLRSVALRFTLANPLVSCVMLGPRTQFQLDQLVREAGKGPPYLSSEQIDGLCARLNDAGAST